MREIKFRAKNLHEDYLRVNKDDEELTKIEPGQIWVYGGYAEIDGRGFIFPERKTHFGHGDFWTDDDVLDIPIVDKNTLGQYTGLTDKHGKEIYEGDVVRRIQKETERQVIGAIEYANCDARFVLRYSEREPGYPDLEKYSTTDPLDTYICTSEGSDEWHYEVIGNIHDNPELIKREN